MFWVLPSSFKEGDDLAEVKSLLLQVDQALNWGRFPDRRVMDFKIFTLEITGKRTGTKPRKRRTLRRLVIRELAP
jgi:hypothetical protein